MRMDRIGEAFPRRYGEHVGKLYLKYLVDHEFLAPEAAGFYEELAEINDKSIHYFISESLTEYWLYLSQQCPIDEEDKIN
jgi:hypothetical protein